MQTIKEIRQSTGLSQAKFCEALEIPRRTLEDWETGKSNPPSYVVNLIAYRVENDKSIPKRTPPICQSAGQFTEKKLYYVYRNDGTSELVAVISAAHLCEAKVKAQIAGYGEEYRIEEAE